MSVPVPTLPGVYDFRLKNMLPQSLDGFGRLALDFGQDPAQAVAAELRLEGYQEVVQTDFPREVVTDHMWNLIEKEILRLIVKGAAGEEVEIKSRFHDWPAPKPVPPLADLVPSLNLRYAHCPLLVDAQYTGPCIKVYRDSDGLQQDIGFTEQGVVDNQAIVDFVTGDGPANGFISVYYDQELSACHVEQTNPAQMPKVYDEITGLIVGPNNLIAPRLDKDRDAGWLGRSLLPMPGLSSDAFGIIAMAPDGQGDFMWVGSNTNNFMWFTCLSRHPNSNSWSMQWNNWSLSKNVNTLPQQPYYYRNRFVSAYRLDGTNAHAEMFLDGVKRAESDTSDNSADGGGSQVRYGIDSTGTDGKMDGHFYAGMGLEGAASEEDRQYIHAWYTVYFRPGEPGPTPEPAP